ncbi:Transposon Tf2-8 polyprotein [Salix suchowensis]|nr:Transposon Tf2-8 polyprotein [Salix suchowensis]
MAFGLAKMQEENVAALRRTARAGSMAIQPRLAHGPGSQPERRAVVPIQKLSPGQMRERQEKGLCYNCDDKWGPGHKFKSARLFIMDKVEPEISIHALCGSPNPKTMRIVGQIGRKTVVILIDTGSTHNFIDPSIMHMIQIPYDAERKM